MNADAQQISDWLDRLYSAAPGSFVVNHEPAQGNFSGRGGQVDRVGAVDRVLELDRTGSRGIYLRATTISRTLNSWERGGSSDAYALPGLWADVDFGTVGHKINTEKQLPLPPDEAEARRIVDTSGLPAPSLWVHSGGGLYPWWLLEQPIIISDEIRDVVAAISSRWQGILSQSAERLGYFYGSGVGDLARVLRIPGTINRKEGLERPCRVIEDNGTVLSLEDILAAAQPAPTSPAKPSPIAAKGSLWGEIQGPGAFDLLDAHVSFDDLLTGAGWKRHIGRHSPTIGECWTRPGDPEHACSAHTLTAQPNALVVWSESAGLPTGAGQKLTRGRLFAHLWHNGDTTAAALDIFAAQRGQGSSAAAALPLPRQATATQLAHPQAELKDPEDAADEAFERQVEHLRRVGEEAERIRVREAARELVAAEKAEHIELPDLVPLDDFLARPLPPVTHLVDGLWPVGGNVLLTAQWKAGKTTLRDNLVRALVDGTPFLGRFDTHAGEGRLALLDVELDDSTFQRWLRDQGIERTDRVSVIPLRGRASSFNILDDKTRARWATLLADQGITRLALDCLRPVLDSLALEESKQAGLFTQAFDALAVEAGIHEKILVHHMGHGAERSRGDSRLLDWPDAVWKLTRLKTDDDPTLDDPAGPRFLSAFGRDVNVSESELTYDDRTRHLTIGLDAGSRAQAK